MSTKERVKNLILTHIACDADDLSLDATFTDDLREQSYKWWNLFLHCRMRLALISPIKRR
jgi:hypothetical protein